MSKRDARIILSALVHDGIDARQLSDKARDQIRDAFEAVLRLSAKS